MSDAILRHACLACGGSCHGIQVPLLGEDERARIERLGAELGVEHPIDGAHLRRVNAHCVFLGADRLCELHRRFGAEAKPRLCQQYPLIALRADGELRVGLDPSCYTAIRTWRDGPAVPEGPLVATRVDLPPAEQAWEARFLEHLEDPDARVSSVLGLLTGAPGADGGLPPGFAERWLRTLQTPALMGFFDTTETGDFLASYLRRLLERVRTLDAANPPGWPAMSAEAEAWALEATRRVIWLRLGTVVVPSVPVVAALLLGGAVSAAWVAEDRDEFGAFFAVWIRALRFTEFVRILIPSGARMAWLVTGRGAGP